jgi:Flp pilus assembly protein TadG
MKSRGQALVELAVTLPVLVFLALGGAEFVRIAITRTGLDAATAAAAAAASRASNPAAAAAAATAAFNGVATGYGVTSPILSLRLGDFGRGGTVTARGMATVNLGFNGTASLQLLSRATARIEDWRSRTVP